jgi:ABC-type Fe3+ transport system permease subunit
VSPTLGIDGLSLAQSVLFALLGAICAVTVGMAAGGMIGLLDFPGRRIATLFLIVPIAAPPAFWWIGFVRVPGVPHLHMAGILPGSIVAGLCFAPVSFLLVLAAIREVPPNTYEAARLFLRPRQRFLHVLTPLLRSALVGGFLLTAILLLGESEIPFLFGFRTVMTDIITGFSRTFSLTSIAPMAATLLILVLIIAGLAVRPIFRTLLAQPRSGAGAVRRPAPPAILLAVAGVLAVTAPLAGYVLPVVRGNSLLSVKLPATLETVAWSIGEPVLCAWITMLAGVIVGYSLRHSRFMPVLLTSGFVVFCIPAAALGIGWIGLARALGNWTAPIVLVHASHLWGLALLGFAAAFARYPASLADAAALVPVSRARGALTFVLPSLAPSLAAISLLVSVLVFSDRDVASLILPPGAERLMLDLYLFSANAPAQALGVLAILTIISAVAAAVLAAAGPWIALRWRG